MRHTTIGLLLFVFLLSSCAGENANNSAPSLSITNAFAKENARTLQFTASLNATSDSDISFDYHTMPGSANADDYSLVGSSGIVLAGDTSTAILITINNDGIIEDDETFDLVISNINNAITSDARATGTIENDDFVSLSITNTFAKENARTLQFTASLNATSDSDISFDYHTMPGSANADDYSPASSSGIVPAGDTSTAILITINNDGIIEDDETFDLVISNINNNAITSDARATGTIENDDFVSLSIADAFAKESARVLRFVVSLDIPFPTHSVSFDYHTISGSANSQTIWKQATASADWSARDAHSSVVFDNKIWVLGGNDGSSNKVDAWFSNDGVKWQEAANAMATRYSHSSVVFDAKDDKGNRIWAFGGFDKTYKNDVWSSKNGLEWQEITDFTDWSARGSHSSVVFDNKIWILGGSEGDKSYKNDVWYSKDGKIWLEAKGNSNTAWTKRRSHSSVVFDNKIWVLGGFDGSNYKNDVWYSKDGVKWQKTNSPASWPARGSHSSVVFDNKIWILGGFDGSNYKNDVWYSKDGVKWQKTNSPASWPARGSHSSVVFDNKIWILGGSDGDKSYKNDKHFLSIVEDYQSISKGNGVIYKTNKSTTIDIQLIDDNILELTDETFDLVISNPVNAKIKKASARGTILPDTANWNKATASWIARDTHSSVVFDNKIWVLGGNDGSDGNNAGSYKNDVWFSSDGKIWQQTNDASWSAREYHSSVVFDNKIWVIGGAGINSQRDVWSSSNGKKWTLVTSDADWPARYSHSSVAFDNKIWVIGGHDSISRNDVWSSSNGKKWTLVTRHANWTRRSAHTSVVFDNKIWVLGGWNNIWYHKNDVWYSSDGKNWDRATSDAWPVRSSHTSVVFDSKIWVLGGHDGSNYKNDVWFSGDGALWHKIEAQTTWPARSEHSSVVFDNKIWVLGGGDGYLEFKNDVWSSGEFTPINP